MTSTTNGFEVATLDGGSVRVSAAQLGELNARMRGRLLSPGDDEWADAVRIWNGMAAKEPALVIQPTSSAEGSVVATAADRPVYVIPAARARRLARIMHASIGRFRRNRHVFGLIT